MTDLLGLFCFLFICVWLGMNLAELIAKYIAGL